MLRLDERLNAIMDNIPKGSVIADIGTDHGKIAVCAVINNIAKYAIATDISDKSLSKARDLVDTYGIKGKISLRLGDGLNVLSHREADTLIIAGMGAREIIDIIDNSRVQFSTYIFVPHKDTDILRKYLSDSLYYLKKDYIVECKGKYYSIIVANKVDIRHELDYKTIMLGNSSIDNSDYYSFVNHEYNRTKGLLENIPKGNIKRNSLKNYLNLLRKELNEQN